VRAAVAALLALALASCGEEEVPAQQRVVGGDAGRGRQLVAAHGCTACHVVPGRRGLQGQVGPTLAGFGARGYIAGHLPNTPENLVRWLRDPPAYAPRTAMPDLGLDEPAARHIAAFLVTLR
jgi:cytochrome c2